MLDLSKLETITRVIGIDAARVGANWNDPKQCVDFAARLRQSIAELSKFEKALTADLTGGVEFEKETAQGNSVKIPGIEFYASVTETVRWSLDTKAVKAEMGAEWYDERCKMATVRGVKYFDVK